MSLNSLRSRLYRPARLLGDVQAVQHHHVVKRGERRVAGKWTGRILEEIFR